jgi:hypothetical protein
VQIRRVLLLFALVLGLSALVASLAPPPDDPDNHPATQPTVASPPPPAGPAMQRMTVRIPVRGPRAPRPTRRVREGSSFSLVVPVEHPGDIVVNELGLRQTADPRTPARFYLVAEPGGRYPVEFEPPLGGRRVIGHLAFVGPETVTRRPRDRRRSAN